TSDFRRPISGPLQSLDVRMAFELFIAHGTERSARDHRAGSCGAGRVCRRSRCLPAASHSSMVAGRSVPAPVTLTQLDLPARLRAFRDVAANHKTGANLDLARVQPVWAAVSVTRRDHRLSELAQADLD